MYKLIVFVPKDQSEILKTGLFKADAGSLGNYSHCSFETIGIGQFKPNELANPAIGNDNELERVEELRIEMMVEDSKIENVIKAIYRFHPYEEPAFDIFQLENSKFRHLKNS